MIESFRDRWLSEYFQWEIRGKRIPADIDSQLFRKLQLIDDATTDVDLRVPPGNHFEKLSGQLENWHSTRVNKQWRLIFQWDTETGKASDLYLDNHSYR